MKSTKKSKKRKLWIILGIILSSLAGIFIPKDSPVRDVVVDTIKNVSTVLAESPAAPSDTIIY